jgi:thiamine biosynthesis lipoprotein
MRRVFFTVLIAVILPAIPCNAKQAHLIQGNTMGTTYHIKIVTGYFQDLSGLRAKIEERLKAVNWSMSNYMNDSEISRFNGFKEVGKQFKISADFFEVMKTAQRIFTLSDGAWDGTVNPLVDLWGFGRAGRKEEIPPHDQITALLPQIGFRNLEILETGFLVKRLAAVTLDLSSIAKGYGVDQVAALIRREGFKDYLVEIGGEVSAAGYREDGRLWRVGINRPQKTASFDDVYKVVDLHNQALATSGDYRNFFEIGGIRYAHVINPRTGYPVANGVVSASIIADACTFADGLATAVMVMGPQKGMELIDRLDKVEGMIVVETADGDLLDYYSNGFRTAE